HRPREHRHREAERFRPAGDREKRQRDAEPDRRSHEAIRAVDVKQARRTAKWGAAHKQPHRLQPARAKQRNELISRAQKRNQVNASKRELKAQPAHPEFGREMHSPTPTQFSAPFRERTLAVNGADGVTRPTRDTLVGRAVLCPPKSHQAGTYTALSTPKACDGRDLACRRRSRRP